MTSFFFNKWQLIFFLNNLLYYKLELYLFFSLLAALKNPNLISYNLILKSNITLEMKFAFILFK